MPGWDSGMGTWVVCHFCPQGDGAKLGSILLTVLPRC